MQNFTPVSALLGGALIGFSAVLLLWFNGRIAGISSIMSGLFTTGGANRHWRISFLIGLMLGAAIWQFYMPEVLQFRQGYPLSLIMAGGFLVGLGTRIGSGCTSGHGICGIALLSPRSIAATLTFMASGLLTVYLIRHLFGMGA
ncbi:YeeE/YedE family protein [Methylomonas sp. LL1]|uniref:YeeE/YedE family protein n=1 Tax=Methylomonas sp. LL1 TaxID=2785785 RepID=UPI0018C3AF87|nr:YeeE/YedE thiosulfate transporter family protein [Methylomonas sp. LL1]QPK65052.1 YeeE/YedE family protein [Methylomonas sp. LL1]